MQNKSKADLLSEYERTGNISKIRALINETDPNTIEHKKAAFLYYQDFAKRDAGTYAYHLFAAAILEQAASQYHLVKGEEGLSLKQINQGYGDSDNLREQAYRSIMNDANYIIGQPIKNQDEADKLNIINEQHYAIFDKDIPLIRQLCKNFALESQRNFLPDLKVRTSNFAILAGTKAGNTSLVFCKSPNPFKQSVENLHDSDQGTELTSNVMT